MFKELKIEDIDEIDERAFFRANNFLSMTPSEWSADFSANWEDLLRKFDLRIDEFRSAPEDKVQIGDFGNGSNYCFYVDEIECFFHIPLDSQNEFYRLLAFNSPLNLQNSIISSVAVEYFIRKFINDINLNWKGENPFKIKFVGLDNQANFDKFDFEVISFEVVLNKINLKFYLLLPEWITDRLEKQFSRNSIIKSLRDDFEDKFLLSFIICSKVISTNKLIEILQKGTIIELPLISLNENLEVIVNNSQMIRSRFLRIGDSLVVELQEHITKDEIIIKPEKSLITISMDSRQYDIDLLKECPRIVEVEDANFPRVDIMISNEVVSKGVLGFYEGSDTLGVKVI